MTGARVAISELPEGDLKTCLATAADFLSAAYEPHGDQDGSAPVCSDELSSVDAELCRRLAPRTRAHLFHAKGKVRFEWAAALLRERDGERGAETAAAVAEMRRAHLEGERHASHALAVLGALAEKVVTYRSLAEFEESGALATVTFERFYEDLKATLREMDPALDSLPRTRTYYLLKGARNAFKDGAYWWSRLHVSDARRMTVSVNELSNFGALERRGLDADSVSYVVVCNWRAGIKLLREAKAELAGLAGRGARAQGEAGKS